MNLATLERERSHAARWVSIYKDIDPKKADEWQSRFDELQEQLRYFAAGVASDGEVVTADQSDWVKAQLVPKVAPILPSEPTIAVNRTGRAERVIRRVMGQRNEDDGDDPKPVPV